MLAISLLIFFAFRFVVGPESSGAHPGPICYRKGRYFSIYILYTLVNVEAATPSACDRALAAVETPTQMTLLKADGKPKHRRFFWVVADVERLFTTT